MGELKEEIKEQQMLAFHALTLYKIKVDISDDDKCDSIMRDVSQPDYVFNLKLKLDAVEERISRYFGQSSDRPEGNIHILVEPPQSKSIDP